MAVIPWPLAYDIVLNGLKHIKGNYPPIEPESAPMAIRFMTDAQRKAQIDAMIYGMGSWRGHYADLDWSPPEKGSPPMPGYVADDFAAINAGLKQTGDRASRRGGRHQERRCGHNQDHATWMLELPDRFQRRRVQRRRHLPNVQRRPADGHSNETDCRHVLHKSRQILK